MTDWARGVRSIAITKTGVAIAVGTFQGPVVYTPTVDLYDVKKSLAAGGPLVVIDRYITEIGGILVATTAKLTIATTPFFLSGTVGQKLEEYQVIYTQVEAGYPTITITFSNAHIIPTGQITMGQGEWTVMGLEIRSVGTTLPTVVVS